jgi:fructokinase
MAIVTIGEVVVDWLSKEPGQTLLTAHEFYRDLGGNATNTAIGLSRLGNHVLLVGKVGADFHGQFLTKILKEEKIDCSHLIVDSRYPSAQCYVITTDSGDHLYSNWPRPHAADMLEPEEINKAMFDSARFIHATGISMMKEPRRTSVKRAIDLAAEAGVIISFDGSFPTGAGEDARTHVEGLVRKAHLLKLNKQEALFWSKADPDIDIKELAELLFKRYRPKALLLTNSRHGSLVVTDKYLVPCPVISVDTVSEVGAGDAYVAGALHWLHSLGLERPGQLDGLSEDDWLRAGMAGNICGAMVTRAISAYASLPTKAEFEDAWASNPLSLRGNPTH